MPTNLEMKIFICSMMLQELLDETEGNSRYKHNLKYYIKSLQKELDILLDEPIESDALGLCINKASTALENALKQV